MDSRAKMKHCLWWLVQLILLSCIIQANLSAPALTHYNQQINSDANHQHQHPHLQQQQPSSHTAGQLQLDQQPTTYQDQHLTGAQQSTNSQTVHRSLSEGPIFRYNGYALNSTTVKLIWNLRNNTYIENFDIDYGPIPESTNVYSITKLNGTTREHTIHGLLPDTLYQFQLRGYNRDSALEPKLVALKTPPMNAAKQGEVLNRDIMPLGVKAEGKSNNSIMLTWTEPEKPANLRNSVRVNVIRYFVNPSQYSSSGQGTGNNNDSSGASNSNSPVYHYLNVTNRESRLIVQKLRPATEYAFAIKTAYWSPDMKKLFTQSGFSMDTIARTYDLEPSPPRNFSLRVVQPNKDESFGPKNQTGIKLELSWLPPESIQGQLKGYVILWMNNSNQWNQIDINETAIDSWSVANVSPGETYHFKMRAINQRGQSQDSEVRRFMAPLPQGQFNQQPIPPNNLLLLIIICMVAILFLLFLIVSRLACRTRSSSRKPRKGSLNTNQQQSQKALAANGALAGTQSGPMPKLNGFATTNSSSTVTARVGTLARRRTGANEAGKHDFWISAMDQQPDTKSNISEKSNSDFNMAMVSIQRDSPQFATTQLAPTLPDYRFASGQQQSLADQLHQGHYHPGHFAQTLGYDQMDNATASALMTLSKRQQQQMQKYQIQFATTAGGGAPTSMGSQQQQAPSPHQQPPPPPPLNIEQQQHHQSLYGTYQPSTLANTRSLRMHRPTLYDPVSGSFLQNPDSNGPPNYNSHTSHHSMHPALANQGSMMNQGQPPQFNTTQASSTLQFHPHQSSTLLSRRSTNTMRSFQTSTGSALYGQLPGTIGQFTQAPSSMTAGANGNIQQPQQLLQSHQAVINQLNNSTYPSLPLKHVSAVRPQIMSSLEDQIEMELAEKESTNNTGIDQQQRIDKQPTAKQ